MYACGNLSIKGKQSLNDYTEVEFTVINLDTFKEYILNSCVPKQLHKLNNDAWYALLNYNLNSCKIL